MATNLRCLFRARKKIQRRSNPISTRTHFSAHRNVESFDLRSLDFLRRRRQRDILRLRVGTVLFAGRDSNVEFSRQVRIGLVAHKYLGKLPDRGRGVEQFTRRKSGHGTPDDVANVVHARLESDEPDGLEPFPNFRDVLDPKPAKLNLLSCGDIGKPFAEFFADLSDGPYLSGIADAIRDPDAHHEAAWGLLAKKNPRPL